MYQAAIYILCIMLSTFVISGINFNNFFKKDRIWEARIFIVIISLVLGYLLAKFLITFMEIAKIF